MQYEIFDMHVHVFPDVIAHKAVRNLGVYYEVPMADGIYAYAEGKNAHRFLGIKE